MTTGARSFEFDNSFVRDLHGLYEPWTAAVPPDPQLLALNEPLAVELGLDPTYLRSHDGVAVLSGAVTPPGAASVAQAYAGHQFGGWSPRLGDGRALLVGEVLDRHGRRRDLHLKGSGRTPFARGGDGKAAVGPMLRELVISESMHALGIPTTRALAVIATGEQIARDTMLPGAVLARIASSHLRVGMFQYAAASSDPTLVQRLADHAIDRHHPAARAAANPYLALYEQVVEAQAALIARWMQVGFVHGVMNTDNMTISGETIDYGPCAFIDMHDPDAVFSSIDHGGRYAYGNQPVIAQWNLARLAETLLPLFDTDSARAVDLATEVLHSFTTRYARHRAAGLRAALGVGASVDDDAVTALGDQFEQLLHAHHVDHTMAWRALSTDVRGDESVLAALVGDSPLARSALADWRARWSIATLAGGGPSADAAAAMDLTNPVYIPRNHLVEEALAAATEGDLAPVGALLEVLADPFTERPGLERYARSAPPEFGRYRTFCGT